MKDIIQQFDQKHPLERKIKFLLDIRGVVLMNNLTGSYVEFGCYNGDMTCFASSILHKTHIQKYIGIDSWNIEYNLKPDKESHTSISTKCGRISERIEIINTNFVTHPPELPLISIAVIDCNYIESIKSCVELIRKYMDNVCIVFIDDYFLDICSSEYRSEIKSIESIGRSCEYYNTYPPFARAIIIYK